jgi:hypothetical protein
MVVVAAAAVHQVMLVETPAVQLLVTVLVEQAEVSPAAEVLQVHLLVDLARRGPSVLEVTVATTLAHMVAAVAALTAAAAAAAVITVAPAECPAAVVVTAAVAAVLRTSTILFSQASLSPGVTKAVTGL